MSWLILILIAFLLGLSLSLFPGPVVTLIRREHPVRGGWSVLTAWKEKALLEVLLACVYTFLAVRIPERKGWILAFAVVGSFVLIFLGMLLIWKAQSYVINRSSIKELKEYHPIPFCNKFLNNLLNPFCVSFWIIGGPMLFGWAYKSGDGEIGCFLFVGAYFLGSLLWNVLAFYHLSQGQRVLVPFVNRLLCSAGGLILAFFGLACLFSHLLEKATRILSL